MPYGVYATADGHVAISMTPVKTLSEALGSPAELAPFEDPDLAFSRRDEIRAADRSPTFATRKTAEWVELLRAHDIWCAPVNDLAETFEDVAVKHLGAGARVRPSAGGACSCAEASGAVQLGRSDSTRGRRRTLGEHTDEVLGELGFSAEDIAAMRSDHDI